MFGDAAKICLGLIKVLDQVIPEAPLPHDCAGRLAGRLDLDKGVGQQVLVAGHFGPAAGGNGFLGGLAVPHDQEQVAVGQPRHVMVGKLPGVVELEIPNQLAFPRELLNSAANARTRAEYVGVAADRSGTQQVTIVEEESGQGR